MLLLPLGLALCLSGSPAAVAADDAPASIKLKPLPSPPPPPTGEELRQAKEALDTILFDLRTMVGDEGLSTRQRLRIFQMSEKALAARDKVTSSAGELQSRLVLDRLVQQAQFLQKVLAAYLDEPSGKLGRTLKAAPPAVVRAEDFAAYEDLQKKLPFLHPAGEQVTIEQEGRVSEQFDSLRSEFYGKLLEAAKIDGTDSRLKGLAGWAQTTELELPGERGRERAAILTSEQLDNLQLK
jgi:hypothetical protein